MALKFGTTVDSLISNLPSFYNEFIYNDEFIKHLFDVYAEVLSFVTQQGKEVFLNTAVNNTELYRNINTSVLTLSKSLYDVNKIAEDFTAEGYGNWFDEDTELKTKVDFLELKGYYEELDSRRAWDTTASEIISLKIAKDFSEQLGYYEQGKDFVIRNNRLFTFNNLAKLNPYRYASKQVLVRDIMVDLKKLENRWGMFFPGIRGDCISRFEYKDFLQSALKFDVTISKMKDVTKILSSTLDNNLRDAYSRKNLPAEYLTQFSHLGPFDFIFKLHPSFCDAIHFIPEGYYEANPAIFDTSTYNSGVTYSGEDATENYYFGLANRIRNLKSFLDIVKPSYSRFYLEGTLPIEESLEDCYSETTSFKINFPSVSENLMDIRPSVYGKAVYGGNVYTGEVVLDTVSLNLVSS